MTHDSLLDGEPTFVKAAYTGLREYGLWELDTSDMACTGIEPLPGFNLGSEAERDVAYARIEAEQERCDWHTFVVDTDKPNELEWTEVNF